MSGKTKGIIAAVGVALAAAAFAGGWFASATISAMNNPRAAFSRLSDAERQQLQNMTPEQRQAFLQQRGITFGGPGGPNDGGPGDNGAPGGFRRGTRVLDGSLTSASSDGIVVALAGGGSARATVDSSTVIAAAPGGSAKLAAGAKVYVILDAEAEGVNVAKAIVVR